MTFGHTLASATNLTANSTALDGEVNYNVRAGLNSGKQTDYYAVQAPASSSGSEDMVATIWSHEPKPDAAGPGV